MEHKITYVSAEAETNREVVEQSVRITCAALNGPDVHIQSVDEFIRGVHATLTSLRATDGAVKPKQEPAVPVKKSVTDDYIICLEDGKKFKSMKRHLAKLGMTPDEYRTKWGLPFDYPVVCKSYSERRSQLAKDSGLGRK